jgi:hypothetical protein
MSHIRAIQTRPESVTRRRSSEVLGGRISRSPAALTALLLSLALAFSLLGATNALAITRDQVLARAQIRVDAPVPYSQSRYYAGYRTDCSGFVSMAWATGTSWTTRSFPLVSHTIPTYQLQPGDALLKSNYHIRLFYGWADAAHTQYVSYETVTGIYAGCAVHPIAESLRFGYIPTRYDHIVNSPVQSNILKNGNFNVWARPWSTQPEQPVWWQATGAQGQLVAHRKDTYHSTHSSLRLVNPSRNPATYTQLTQSVPVVAGANYRLTAWAACAYNSRVVELKLVYLNAAGRSVAEITAAGNRFYINRYSFRSMYVLLSAPAGAVRALVSVRLAGAVTTNTAGVAVPGTAVTIDDISLVRSRAVVGIKTSATTAYTGRKIALSGLVTPSTAVGVPAVLYVLKPGLGWARVTTTRIYASGSAAAWKDAFTFTSSMRRGTYRFRTTIPDFKGILGSTSAVVSVTLK